MVTALLFLAGTAGTPPDLPRIRGEAYVSGFWAGALTESGFSRTGPALAGGVSLRRGKRTGFQAELTRVETRHSEGNGARTNETTTGLSGSVLLHFKKRPVQPYIGIGIAALKREFCADVPWSVAPHSCVPHSGASLLLQAGVKIVNRRGLLIAPEVRLDEASSRFGMSVGWAWAR